MSFFKRIFTRDKPRKDFRPPGSDAIRAYDSQGREYYIEREVYRKKVLPYQFKEAASDPDRLYNAIVVALRDGFFAETVGPARELLEVDSNRERATTVLGIALMRSGELDAAEALLVQYLRELGRSGVILTNLAKVYAARGSSELAERTLWTSLTVDPNQQNALDWWGAIHRERGGEEAFLEAMRRVSQIPGSWRAQLWLARNHLENGRLSQAITIYQSALPVAGEFGDALMMISGDLGKNGYLQEAVDIVAPIYDAEKHGPLAGLNLIQVCIQLGDKGRGRKLLAQVQRLHRYDLVNYLEQLRQELA